MAQRKRYDANANVIGSAVGCTDLAAFSKADLRALAALARALAARADEEIRARRPSFPSSLPPARPGVVAAARRRSGAARVVGLARRGGAALPASGTKPEAPAGARRYSMERGREVFQEACHCR